MGSDFARAVHDLVEEDFQALYGRWDPMGPDGLGLERGELPGRAVADHGLWRDPTRTYGQGYRRHLTAP